MNPRKWASDAERKRAARAAARAASANADTNADTNPDNPPTIPDATRTTRTTRTEEQKTEEPGAGVTIAGNVTRGPERVVVARSEVAPARVRDPATGRFPARPAKQHVPCCPPASPTQYARAVAMISAGSTWAEVREATGAHYTALSEAAIALDDWAGWTAARSAHDAAVRAELVDTGQVLLRVARAELPSREEESTGPGGATKRRILERAAAAAQAGAALVAPELHGRQARLGPAVQVNVGVGARLRESAGQSAVEVEAETW